MIFLQSPYFGSLQALILRMVAGPQVLEGWDQLPQSPQSPSVELIRLSNVKRIGRSSKKQAFRSVLAGPPWTFDEVVAAVGRGPDGDVLPVAP